MKQYKFSAWILFFVCFVIGCRPSEPTTPTPTVEQQAVATIVVERPSLTSTSLPTVVTSLTPTPSLTPVPIVTAATTNVALDVPAPEPSLTPVPTPTATPTPLPTPTPVPSLPGGVPLVGSWTGIGTAVPLASSLITADNLTEFSEVARWGKGRIVEALYSPDGSQIYALTWQGLYVYDAATAQQLEFRPYSGVPGTMALSSDGQTLAVAMRAYPSYVELRHAITNEFITAFLPFEDATTPIDQIAFDQSNQILLAFSEQTTKITAWDIVAAHTVTARILPYAYSFDFNPQTQMAAFVSGDDLEVWQWRDRNFYLVSTLTLPDGMYDEFFHIAFSPDGQYVAAGQGTYDMKAAVWRVADGELLHVLDSLPLHPRGQGKRRAAPPQVSGPGRDHLSDVQFSPDGRTLAVTTGFQNLVFWDLATGQSLRQLSEVGDEVIFTPDGTAIAVWRHSLSQWRVDDGSFINTLNQHIGAITDLALVPQRSQLAVASADRFVYLRRLGDGALTASLRADMGNSRYYIPPMVMAIDVTTDGGTLVSASADAYRLWNLDDYSMIELLPPPVGGFGSDEIIISYDGQYIMGKEHDIPVQVWLRENIPWQEDEGSPNLPMTFSPVDYLVAATDYFDGNVFLWSPESRKEQDLPLDPALAEADLGYMETLAFAANGRFLAGGTDDGNVLLWTVTDNLEGEFLRLIELPDTIDSLYIYGMSMVFSPDNSLLVVRTAYDVWFLSMEDGRLLHRHRMMIPGEGVLLSEDGRYLITGHADGSVRFWAVP